MVDTPVGTAQTEDTYDGVSLKFVRCFRKKREVSFYFGLRDFQVIPILKRLIHSAKVEYEEKGFRREQNPFLVHIIMLVVPLLIHPVHSPTFLHQTNVKSQLIIS